MPDTPTPGENALDAAVSAAQDHQSEHTGLPLLSPDVAEAELADELDNIVPTRGYEMLPMVGLGGSAGSIGALQAFFGAMPPKSGMVFVVILHLAPEFESSLAELIGRATRMPVVQAVDGVKVEMDHVYVIPPGKHLTSADGHLRLTDLHPERGRRVAVDLFFRTLADTHGPHSAAIVLSGADGDGAIGIKRIKERGGLTIAQDPEEAEHNEMPRAAIGTGMVDWVLQVAEMPARLVNYVEMERRLKLPPEDGPQPSQEVRPVENGEGELRDILSFLRTRTGRDFSYYKRATIVRRISRRMQVNGVDNLADYLAFIRTHPGEAGALLQDLLISVTNFFRDRKAFSALERMLPELFHGKGPQDTVRVWVAACATGEEAYSIAMMLCEYARELDAPPSLQVFATDLDEAVIHAARDGLFPDAITSDVSEERLRRFFLKEHRGFRMRREVREIVLFALHDLLKDSPFSRLDLISCRNLLIYLNRDAQRRAMDIFNFALKPGGILFLGSSETVDEGSALFSARDKTHRIFGQHPTARTSLPVPLGRGMLSRSLELSERQRERPTIPSPAMAQGAVTLPGFDIAPGGESESWSELHFKLLERISPPSVLVSKDYEILHLSERAGYFLQIVGGEPTRNLVRLVHPMLRIELRASLYRAAQTGVPTETFHVPFELDGVSRSVSIRVTPAYDIAPDHLLVVFEMREASLPAENVRWKPEAESVTQPLERELERTKVHLREVVEQYEASVEELKASNEELQAMNEELRSATEELETGREELQSINEELTTVNLELKSKVDEVGHANSDLQNLMSSTAIATVFLDRDLCITRYTPPAVELFNLIPTDVGRPLSDLSKRIDYPALVDDARRVLATLVPLDREVSTADDRHFIGRILPYRTVEDHIAGLVLTFVDITGRKRAEGALRTSEEQMRLVVESAQEFAIFSTDLDMKVTTWNTGAERILGYAENEIVGQNARTIFTPEDRTSGGPEQEQQQALAEGRARDERWHVRKDGTRLWGEGFLMPMHDPSGATIGFVKILRDQTAARTAQQELETSRSELWKAVQENERARDIAEEALRTKDHFLAVLSHELRTPLTPVLVAVQTLARRHDLPPAVSRALEMIQRNVLLEARFIDDLLDLTRISRGKIEIVREPLDMHEVLRQAVEISMPDVDAKTQRLHVSYDAERSRLSGDFTRLQQIFWNLLKNASKFTPEGGEISIRSRDDDGHIVVEIIDSGMGIEATDLERIFDPFEQGAATVSRQYGGLGLGLAIAKATVVAHEGSLQATSLGTSQGATFTVRLPVLGRRNPDIAAKLSR